jgi:predicted DNA-binding transcriptional regulator YafY
LGEQKFYQGFIKEQKTSEGVVMNFMTLSMEGFARWYMTFADYALILEPQSLKDRVHSLFLAIEKKINPPKPC